VIAPLSVESGYGQQDLAGQETIRRQLKQPPISSSHDALDHLPPKANS
jgi:hypothetical protein